MPDPVSALVVGGTQVVGSYLGGRASKKAASAQSGAAALGIDEQRRQFDSLQALLRPYTNAGIPALSGQQDLLGLRGYRNQQGAIQGIAGGPQMQALIKQGEDAILQNASATGGLRGGNVQGALAQFRPQLLNQLIDQQYNRLGGIVSIGQNAAAGVGNAGMQTGDNVANLFAQQGAAQAGGILGQAGAYGNVLNMPAQFAGLQYATGKTPQSFKSLFGS